MLLNRLRLKKNEDRRLRLGHLWVYSNEVDTIATPLKNFIPGEEVLVEAHDKTPLGVAYINPNSLITARLFSRDVNERLTTDFLIKRIQRAYRLRSRLFSDPFYRLIFGESDGLPGLVVDRFDEVYVVQINTAGMDVKTTNIIEALLASLPDVKAIILRNDSSARKQEGLESFINPVYGDPPDKIRIVENGFSFYAPLLKGQKTGWFYDHRSNRARLKDYVEGMRVLDVFSYVGSWGLHAAHYGAAHVTFIDSSAEASFWVQENATFHGLNHKIDIITEDAFKALKLLQHEKQKYDVIILDPPAFIKKKKDKAEGLIAYQRINEAAIKLLDSEGILVTCSCSMHMEYEALRHILARSWLHTKAELQIIERGHQAGDHPIHSAIPETDYLKMIIARKVTHHASN